MKKIEFDRDETINWLKNSQNNGAFEGFSENKMNFNKLSDKNLEWYFQEWVLPDRENA